LLAGDAPRATPGPGVAGGRRLNRFSTPLDRSSLSDHIRCVSDEQIRAVAARGGLIGIISGKFLRPDIRERGSNLDDYLNHIDHVIQLVGPDHVCIGVDVAYGLTAEEWAALDAHYPELFDGATRFFDRIFSCPELRDADKQKLNLIEGMIGRGYDDATIRKILGENLLRLFGRVWKPSALWTG
jgi:membrane dipeptidase